MEHVAQLRAILAHIDPQHLTAQDRVVLLDLVEASASAAHSAA